MANIAVTGAKGYVGSRIARFLEEQGHQVFRFVRHPDLSEASHVRFSLNLAPVSEEFRIRHITVLIHAAYDFAPITQKEIQKVNVDGSWALREAAERGGVQQIILISTLSAFEGTPSLYGQAKLAIERDVIDHGGVVVRSGLVFGERPGGMFGRIQQRAERGGLTPVLNHPAPLYLTHEADLVGLIAALCTGPWPPPRRLLIAAGQRPWTLSSILTRLAFYRGRSIRLIPVPWHWAWSMLRTAEKFGFHFAFKSDSILALTKENPDVGRAELRPDTVRFREFAPGG